MARLIDDLLDVTRIARGKLTLRRTRIELNELVRSAVEDVRDLFASGGVALEARLADEPLWVDGDATRLAQVVGNLLQNAAKFTPRGGRAVVTVEREEAGASIWLRDTGIGMTPEMLTRLFEPFAQADRSLDRSRGGLGLGLALAKAIVVLHGGSVTAESPGPGRGSEFVTRLPLAAPQPSTGAAEAGSTSTARRVLVIEDNLDAAQSLKEALEIDTHLVEVALSGSEGIDKARVFRPDVILCDIGLPGLDGYGVAKRLRADASISSVFLVALSGYAAPDDVERSREAGFDLHLAKPPALNEIERVLAQSPSRGSVLGDELGRPLELHP